MTWESTAFMLGSLLLSVACSTESPPNQEANAAEPSAQAARSPSQIDWKAVDKALGRTGTMQPGNVRRYGMPRSDMRVTVKGVRIKPGFALGSWLAMTPHGDGVMAMGDMVLKESEVAPVMTALQTGGVEQTGVHHHVLHETPRVLYMHMTAMGDPVRIAETIKAALALTKTPPAAQMNPGGNAAESGGPAAAPADDQAQNIGIDTAQIEQIIGHKGKVNSGVFQVSVPRAHAISEMGMEIPPSMGVATAINFQPTGNGRAGVTGDYVMTADEVNNVIRALRENGIEATSLHNHALFDEPRMFYMHFWANDDAVKLARGLRAALDKTNSTKGQTK